MQPNAFNIENMAVSLISLNIGNLDAVKLDGFAGDAAILNK